MCDYVWGCGWATNIHGSKWSSMCMCILFDRQCVKTLLFLGCNVCCMERIASLRNTWLLTLLQWQIVHSPLHGVVWWFYSFLQSGVHYQSGHHFLYVLLIQKIESFFFLESGPMHLMCAISFFLKIKNKKLCITFL